MGTEVTLDIRSCSRKVADNFDYFFGLSSFVRRRDRDVEKRSFDALLQTLPPAVHIYTDGSSFGNPGPSGSGFVVYDQNNEVICCRSHALGTSTNAYAEVDGLMEAAEYAELDLPSGLWNLPVCLFVDNRNAISLAAG